MLIPFSNCMVAGMETTFSELKAKHLKLLETQWQLREQLQDKAGELLREYAESLSLPADTWTDSLGKIHPYVDIGTWSGPGKFEPVPLARLQMDDNYSLNFVIATTLDDTPMTGGYRHGVNVTLRYEKYQLYASVGSGDDAVIIPVSSKPGGFFEVCAAIKQLINIAIERATPAGIPVE
ncbi:hypothetical protein AA23_00530 [Salmonella enterica subsp. enterica]|nr:hypothetical protein [Salmonella enterica subsp. enterica]ECY4646241.1 hypothetical protein [Salmonella enterica subsp. enterica serovar Eastbourne]ELE1305301.1 hypothetical protein [Salmonella enterica]ECH9416649.1 hypothetical protein [Salmonella enterica subsp. enterica]ECI2258316.1 hypothetical protein [Salmonella enterica subsp. enterica]